MNPQDWTSLVDWMAAFRALHEQARRGKLDPHAVARYEQDREVLAKALLIAQRLSVKSGQTARQTLRVHLTLPVKLVFGDRREQTTTLDLGLGGFAAFLPKSVRVLERPEFSLTLRSGGRPVNGRAKVVNVQRKGQPYRVAFSFEDLPPAEAQRIGLEVFDAALATIPPN
jgi:hypothetical protein